MKTKASDIDQQDYIESLPAEVGALQMLKCWLQWLPKNN